ncbi:MAG: HdeD family acid-resistance protein [Candidatus Weimeria sp.]
MKEKIKESRASQYLIAILAILLGVFCIVDPGGASAIVGKVIGIVIAIVGIVMILSRISDESLRLPAIILGAVICAIGLYIFSNPNGMLKLIFVVFGVLMIADGVSGISMAFTMKGIGTPTWWPSLLMALISFIFGVLCILGAMDLLKIQFIFIGIMLIYDGVTSFYSLIKVHRAEKGVVDSKIVNEKDI